MDKEVQEVQEGTYDHASWLELYAVAGVVEVFEFAAVTRDDAAYRGEKEGSPFVSQVPEMQVRNGGEENGI